MRILTRVVSAADVSTRVVRRDARRALEDGSTGIAVRQRERFIDLLAFARRCSPYYRGLYAGLPAVVSTPSALPVTRKADLMARFDEVVTDRRVRREDVNRFIADPSQIGVPYLDDHLVATTSGTTGTRGTFLWDQGALAVLGAMSGRMVREWLTFRDVAGLVVSGGRVAIVSAGGGHFASTAAAAWIRRSRVGAGIVRLFSVHTPLPDLAHALSDYRPAVLAAYATTAVLLATEQEAGRLGIHPALVVLAAEGIPEAELSRIAEAFGAKVGSTYVATECPFLSYQCSVGWMHVNSDWAILEPVQADYSPTPPGEQSHSVLLTNLANRVQPILRYDLRDSVVARPDRCECGSPLPALRVQGRTAEMLSFPGRLGDVAVTTLSLSALIDRHPGVELAQLVHVRPDVVRVRLRAERGAEPEAVWQAVLGDLTEFFDRHGAAVTLERADEPPEASAGGKYRLVEPLR